MNETRTKPLKKIGFLIIEGRRWFEKINGNTYHSVKVMDKTKLIGKVNFAYGYGSHFEQTALQILKDAGYFDLPEGQYSRFYRELQEAKKIYVTCSDVARKRDLKFWVT